MPQKNCEPKKHQNGGKGHLGLFSPIDPCGTTFHQVLLSGPNRVFTIFSFSKQVCCVCGGECGGVGGGVASMWCASMCVCVVCVRKGGSMYKWRGRGRVCLCARVKKCAPYAIPSMPPQHHIHNTPHSRHTTLSTHTHDTTQHTYTTHSRHNTPTQFDPTYFVHRMLRITRAAVSAVSGTRSLLAGSFCVW